MIHGKENSKMKELYIAPEVEILCFMPVEALAADTWGWSTFGAGDNGTGQLPGTASDTTIEGGGTDSGDSDLEGDEN